MKLVYHEEPYYSTECAILLARVFAPADSYAEERNVNHIDAFLKKMGREYPAQIAGIRERLEPLRIVSEYLLAQMTVPAEKMNFYFRLAPGCQLVPGIALALMDRQGIDAVILPPEKRHKIIAGFLQSCFLSGNDVDTPEDEAGLADWLERQALTAEDKWICLRLYQRTEEYQAECRAILGEAVRLYQEKRAVWEPVLRECTAGFREKIEQNGPDYIPKRFHVKFDIAEMEIYPSLSGFNMLSLSNFTEDEMSLEGRNMLDVGYMIEELLALDDRDSATIEQLNSQLKAIGDKRRLEILTALRNGPLCGQEIAEHVGLTPATVSHHMNELVSSGFVDLVKEGTRVNYLYSSSGMDSFMHNIQRQFG